MTADVLTCTVCNALQPARPGLALGQRVSCARCGEAFTVTTLPEALTTAPRSAPTAYTSALAAEPPPAMARPHGPRQRNWRVAALVLGVMLLMSGIGLTYALVTQDYRRHNDTSLPRKARRPSPARADDTPTDAPLSPGQLPALAYLPLSTNVLAAADVRTLRSHPQWASLRRLRLGGGPVALQLEQLPAWTGLEESEIDHVALAATLRAGEARELTPPITLIVRTTGDHDPAKVRKALKAIKPVAVTSADGVKRSLYRAKLGALPVTLWQPDARTVVLGLFDQDLKNVPGQPHRGAAQLSAELREALEKRLPGAPPVWAVCHSADWSKTLLPTLLAGVKDVPLTDLGRVRTLVLSLALGTPGKVLWQVEAADEATAKELEAKVLAPRAKAAAKGMKYGRDGAWLSVQTDVDLAAGGGG